MSENREKHQDMEVTGDKLYDPSSKEGSSKKGSSEEKSPKTWAQTGQEVGETFVSAATKAYSFFSTVGGYLRDAAEFGDTVEKVLENVANSDALNALPENVRARAHNVVTGVADGANTFSNLSRKGEKYAGMVANGANTGGKFVEGFLKEDPSDGNPVAEQKLLKNQ